MRNIILCTILSVSINASGQGEMATGEWYKLSIETTGVYRIDHGFLRKLGINPAAINPDHIRIFGWGGGMLPQANSAPRPQSLQENAIYVHGAGDGRFDGSDFILFFAEGPDAVAFDPTAEAFRCERNLYSDLNFYFLNIGQVPGKRIAKIPNAGTGYPLVNTFYDYYHHEYENYNELRSGREWYGEKFGISTLTHRFDVTLPGIVAGSTIALISDVMGQSHSPARFVVSLNSTAVGEHDILPIANSRYGPRGIDDPEIFRANATDVGADKNATLQVQYEFFRGSGFSQAYLDYFTLTVERELQLYNNCTVFTSVASAENPTSEFSVSGVGGTTRIWDVTEASEVAEQEYSLSNNVASFSTATSILRRFAVFNDNVPAPGIAGKLANQDLRNIRGVDMIIVTHPDFIAEAERLATHRESQSSWIVEVVTTDQVFNEFSSGRQDVSAIRDFVKHVYDETPGRLKTLLLFGRGSYDYKSRIPKNTNLVPTYESRNSLEPLQSYSSDDYYAFLEAHEGTWEEHHNINYSLDIGVGRLPAITVADAKAMVDKIIAYETNGSQYGHWRKRFVFVADDGNNVDGYSEVHQSQADQLSNFVQAPGRGVDVKKLFMGSYHKTVKPNGETVPAMTSDIERAFEQGALVINYSGHGSELQWGDENVLNGQHITALENTFYPFLVTATCEFGRNDDPEVVSSAEKSIIHPGGGSIGLVTTARLVNVETNFNLNLAFYEALFQRNGNDYLHIGEVFRRTKNNSTSGVANRNFTLLGDPSMKLALPPHVISITEIKTDTGSDTLKALSTVEVKGEVTRFDGATIDTFHGLLTATLFDKQTTYQTIGKNNPPFVYAQWDNALFRGQATVSEGQFTMRFRLPGNIDYSVGLGKLSLYAVDTATYDEAAGIASGFKIGLTEPGVERENNPPMIKLFMADTTFVNGGVVTPDTDLIARITDDSGVNISSYGVGNSLVASLDDDAATFVLNDYFIADPDDPTSGWLRFPLKDLPTGRHQITVKAWDLYNNTSAATIDFVVTSGDGIVIESFGNYPNPFSDFTTLFFTHNRSGEHLSAELHLLDLAGSLIQRFEFDLPDSEYRTDLLELSDENFAKKAAPGIYLARLIVRSHTDGSKNERVTRLLLSN